MKVGDLVRAKHWPKPIPSDELRAGYSAYRSIIYYGLVLRLRVLADGEKVCRVLLPDGWQLDQLSKELEIVSEIK